MAGRGRGYSPRAHELARPWASWMVTLLIGPEAHGEFLGPSASSSLCAKWAGRHLSQKRKEITGLGKVFELWSPAGAVIL